MFLSSVVGPNYDLHLKAGSPAIGRGDASKFPSTDFDGQTRTNPPDAGADEYSGAVTPPPPPPPPPKPGDLNSDGTVNITDLSILLSSWNTTSATADINKDGTVNILDLSILLSNYGT
jgi:hypothetical protein